MLDTETRRRIDTCRDILVGKIPDPKSQVEQITIALIYKFMDDMDLDSEALGGQRKFFTGDFERYAWGKLVASGTSGQDMLNTYGEALQRMTENEKLPALFRDIFRNAYLPYRDPETLRSFLREINGFTYDHSERLGDAFEYLLSVLGSQGDAGQFRTPRHIIDFMVAVIDPKKDEVILDPACGTAGFLISSYKHILKANSSVVETNGTGDGESAVERPIESPLRFTGDLLTPEDRQRLARNIKGYDISPDMVRLSLVNLYLHGFANPRVEEYDTLTSEEKWSEMADVILANPPFMSPKGGIRPHNRFSISATRSEVLFVDYIAEHLTPKGRAAVIVPEGVIFQSGTAYRALRKALVEKYLVAVVSLPAGVFNPYSGVKTSILICDRMAAKGSDTLGFFKITNDGFNLGAQRRPVGGSELPEVLAEIADYCSNGEEAWEGKFGWSVTKAEIASSGDYNLSADRYRSSDRRTARFPQVSLGDVADISSGNPAPQGDDNFAGGTEPFIRTSDVGRVHLSDNFIGTADKLTPDAARNHRMRLFPKGTILLPKSGASTFLNHRVVMGEPAYVSSHLACIVCDEEKLLPQFAYRLLCDVDARKITPDQAYPSLRTSQIADIEIPLPPLNVQREIVAEIEGYQKVIDGARAVLENYRPHIAIDPDWPMVALGEIIDRLETGVSVNSANRPAGDGEIGVLKTSAVTSGTFEPGEHKTILPEEQARAKCSPRKDSIIISRMNTEQLVGASAYVDRNFDWLFLPDRLWQTTISRNDVCTRFVQTLLASDAYRQKISARCGGTSGSMKNISQAQFLGIEIPLPAIETQRAVVAELEAERALVEANHQLVARMEVKIEAAIARVWGDAEHTASEEVAA